MSRKLHIVWGFSLIWLLVLDGYSQISTSVLSEGDWYKIAVLNDGVHKIDYAFLSEVGLDIDGLNPTQLAIYGNAHNGMLTQRNDAERPDDLAENAIFVSGESDGNFDVGDYLLFYGKSLDHLSYDPAIDNFLFERNVYSDTAFYFLTLKDTGGKRMTSVAQPASATLTTTYKSFDAHELEDNAIIRSGRHWYGERFTTTNRSHQITYTTAGVVKNSDIRVYLNVLSRSTGTSSFDISANGLSLGSINMNPISSGTYVTQADVKKDTFNLNSSTVDLANGLRLSFQFNESGFSDGYVDYAHLVTEKSLDLVNGELIWYKRDGEESYKISGGAETTWIWNISDPLSVISIQPETLGNDLLFGSTLESTKYVALNEGQESIPIFVKKIANQNLHGLAAADGIIITHGNFLAPAQRLADFRAAHDGLLVEVVTVDQIFNEFSSGAQDVTAIRDFIKLQYEKYSQLQYVLFFGDCSFDYKDRSLRSTNFVPVYESRNSLHPLWSYSSDDYFGFMDAEEGDWTETQAGDHTMEIGIGRIPIQTEEDGEAVVNKIIRYQTNRLGYGNWRNKITFIADDGDNNIHQQDANMMATYVDTTRKELNVNKLFLDAYEQDQNKSPQASSAFLDAISRGNLIVNFTGHGNEGQLTHEDIFNELMISDLNNNILMPLFITATCQFGNYDNPNQVSGGEQMVLLPYGGAVALITATRPVFSNTNYQLNEAFYFSAMQKENGEYKRLGDIMRETKNNSLAGAGNRNYALLGDPMLRIAFPRQEVVLTAINGKPLDQLDTLKTFGKYKVSGEVQAENNLDSKFSGVVSMTVFDKPSKFQTLGDESVKEVYEQRDVLLFQGQATVTEGKFDIEFVVPKNIDYSFGEGKLNFYAVNNTTTVDAHGEFSEIIVGGSEKVVNPDRSAPDIDIFLNDTTFISGQVVGPSPILLVRLTDESGINTSNAGFGNELILTLNDTEPIVLNNYYSASLDTYQEGWVSYPLDNLEPGRYQATIDASDIFNNSVQQTVEFFITEENSIKLTEVMSYPNPIMPGINETTISFKHDRLGEDLQAFLTITDMQGNKILTETYRFDNVSENTLQIVWNLASSGAGRIRKGIYIYRLKVQSKVDNSAGDAFRRVVILN
ncbi:MAG: type IX secretion system sortase PorU [Reichenbachiella sp.]|uniref:type IX secretion system sortase PorU n=3 Tax=Reichenbachiella sp. TaxID=2184521 RepID=UPI00326316B8